MGTRGGACAVNNTLRGICTAPYTSQGSAGACEYILRLCDIIHRHILHGPTTPAPVYYVMCIIKPARILCQGLAMCAYYDYDSSARDD